MRVDALVSISGHVLLPTGDSQSLHNTGPTSMARVTPCYVCECYYCVDVILTFGFISINLFVPFGFCIYSGQSTGRRSGCGKLSKRMKSTGMIGHGGVGGCGGTIPPCIKRSSCPLVCAHGLEELRTPTMETSHFLVFFSVCDVKIVLRWLLDCIGD